MENDFRINTSITTRIGTDYRVSSIYRRYANSNFETFAWETLVWNKDNKIVEMESYYSIDNVIEAHEKFFNKYNKGG